MRALSGSASASMTWRIALLINALLGHVLAVPVRLYRLVLSPVLPPACRFEPSCSAYAMEALQRHGAWPGLGFTVHRLSRCHPWGSSGHDPVPVAGPDSPSSHVPASGSSEHPGETDR